MLKHVPLIKCEYPSSWDALCILGPTASGKTKFAVDVALGFGEWCNGEFIHKAEILSADSRQVYRGMDIGTGKDLAEFTVKTENGVVCVPCHLIDIADAGDKYNIFRYQQDFSNAYKDVVNRGRIPIICGGSGLYIAAATKGYELKEVSPNIKLREELVEKSMDELVEMLTTLKKQKGYLPHNDTDFDTKKRLIRAIEIEQESSVTSLSNLCLPQRTKFIGINVNRETRNARIDARLIDRLNEGMVQEVKSLLDSGISADDLIYYGLEYKFITLYLIGELSYEQMVEQLKIAIHQFAKRQMTWFRGMERKGTVIEWIDF